MHLIAVLSDETGRKGIDPSREWKISRDLARATIVFFVVKNRAFRPDPFPLLLHLARRRIEAEEENPRSQVL